MAFVMWMLQPAAYGAFGLMCWYGNRWHGDPGCIAVTR
jgi:hypothetical protein